MNLNHTPTPSRILYQDMNPEFIACTLYQNNNKSKVFIFSLLFQVAQKRWKVDTYSKLDSVLLLSAVNLPGGELVSLKVSRSLLCIYFHQLLL